MSRLDQLIAETCPDGVEYYELGDIARIDGNGVDKKINENHQKVMLLNYMDVYRNRFINESVLSMEVTATKRQVNECDIQEGDIFITPTSETVEDLAHSAVVISTIERAVYSYHVKRIRLKNKCMISSYYLNYLFRSSVIQDQILRKATGLTRFGLSSGSWSALRIPFPPIQVQEEIVRILDTFTALEAELEAELQARTQQYETYRDALLNFDPENPHPLRPARLNRLIQTLCPDGFEQKRLGEICIISNGKDHKPLADGDYPVYGTGGIMRKVDQYVYDKPSVLIPRKGSLGNIYFVDEPFWVVDTIFYTKIDNSSVLPKYLYYLLINEHLEKLNEAGGVPSLTKSVLDLVILSIPPLPVQEEIVAILDRFDALVNDLKNGLPAEIAARRKQYEYYRDQLLTFKPLE